MADIRRPYLDSTVINQDFLDLCAANLANRLELIVDIETPDGSTIRASDRNKYVDGVFYEALLNFPIISRTVGEWLTRETEFDTLEIELNNSGGRFNNYLPGGDDFGGSWSGKSVRVAIGLRDVGSTYFDIFQGSITDVAGVSRKTYSIVIKARNKFDRLTKEFPTQVFRKTSFPDIEADLENMVVPLVLGDWTVNIVDNTAAVPSFVVNGGATSSGFSDCVHAINTGSIDNSKVFLKRGDLLTPVPDGSITDNSDGSMRVAWTFNVDGAPYEYSNGDVFYVRYTPDPVEGTVSNGVLLAKYLLKAYGGLTDTDFSTQWAYFAAKTTPTESATANIPLRVWVQEPESLIEYVKSMLQQLRLELFINKDLKIDLVSTHFDEWPVPSYKVRDWDLELNSADVSLPEINQFNRSRGIYNFSPLLGEEAATTGYYRNQAAIDAQGLEKTFKLITPNLYREQDVINFVQETLKIASAGAEILTANLTWRSLLLDVGDFVLANISIDGLALHNVPCMVRSLGYDPDGIKLPVTLWVFQMVPYPGYTPGYPGTVGGSTAIISAE